MTGGDFAQNRFQMPVYLDGRDGGRRGSQGERERAQTAADFQNRIVGLEVRRPYDPIQSVPIDKEVLSQTLLRS